MLSNVTRLLQQLQSNLPESESQPFRALSRDALTRPGVAIVSGTRLPFEALEPPLDLSDSDMTDDEDDIVNELTMRLSSVVDVIPRPNN